MEFNLARDIKKKKQEGFLQVHWPEEAGQGQHTFFGK